MKSNYSMPQLRYDAIDQCPEQCRGAVPGNATLFMGSTCIDDHDGPEQLWELTCGVFRDEKEFNNLAGDEFYSRIFECRGRCDVAQTCIFIDRMGVGSEHARCYADSDLRDLSLDESSDEVN